MRVFAYGSLINDYREQIVEHNYKLKGYQRVLNAIIDDGYVYYNLVPNIFSSVIGDIIEVNSDDMYDIIKREKGYDLINLGDFYVFISRNTIGVAKKTYIDKSK